MQAQIPQYIEIEDKVIGPLTLRQFGYVTAGIIVTGLVWYTFKTAITVVIAPVVLVFFGAAAFYEINGRPFLAYVFAALKHSASASLYVWRNGNVVSPKTKTVTPKPIAVIKKGDETLPPTLREQREKSLFALSWQLNTGETRASNEID